MSKKGEQEGEQEDYLLQVIRLSYDHKTRITGILEQLFLVNGDRAMFNHIIQQTLSRFDIELEHFIKCHKEIYLLARKSVYYNLYNSANTSLDIPSIRLIFNAKHNSTISRPIESMRQWQSLRLRSGSTHRKTWAMARHREVIEDVRSFKVKMIAQMSKSKKHGKV